MSSNFAFSRAKCYNYNMSTITNKGKVSFGIIGCARVAQKHAIPALRMLPEAELVCVASRDPARAKLWAEQYSISFEQSYDDLLTRKDIDAVYIPLPVGLHEEWVLKAAKAKKHILCEKSLSGSLASVRRMIDCCRSAGVALYENIVCDVHPQHEAVVNLLKEEKVGEWLLFKGCYSFLLSDRNDIRFNRGLGGGALNDVGVYPIFMARKLLGSEPLAVTANLTEEKLTGVDICGSVYMEFPGQKSGFAAFGFDMLYQNNYELVGKRGAVRVLRAYAIPAEMQPSVQLIKDEGKEVITPLDVSAANQFQLSIRRFCKMILEDDRKSLEACYRQAIGQAEVMEAIRISARENRKVMMSELNQS